MRLFIALSPSDEAMADLRSAVARLRDLAAGDPNLRWSTEAQWHLTLAFLGEVGEDRLPELSRRLARAAGRHQPIRLRLAGAGGFGSTKAARVLWVGVDGDQPALRALAGSVSAGARRSGIDVREARRFRAHLTLARLREPTDVRPYVDQLADYSGPEWIADRVELIRSYLGQGESGRARYETVQAFALGRRTAAPPR